MAGGAGEIILSGKGGDRLRGRGEKMDKKNPTIITAEKQNAKSVRLITLPPIGLPPTHRFAKTA